jgi:hypothetical protein
MFRGAVLIIPISAIDECLSADRHRSNHLKRICSSAGINADYVLKSDPCLICTLSTRSELCEWAAASQSDITPSDDSTQAASRRLCVSSEQFVWRFSPSQTNPGLLEAIFVGCEGQHHLRTLLQEHPFACLIATSQQLFKAVSDRSEPFFGFFQPIPLRPLSLQDAQQLLLKIATFKDHKDLIDFLNTPEGQRRVRAIHDLAGGNHRVCIVLGRFHRRDSLDQLMAPFQRMLDDLTPFYQERIHSVSPLQRQIVELLCGEHCTLNPKEIARRLLLPEQSIGKQVRNLAEIGYLTSQKKGRETCYELSEPLMRLTYN